MDLIDEVLEFEEAEIIERLFPERHPYTVRERINYMHYFDSTEFMCRFRLSKNSVEFLLENIENSLVHETERNHVIPPIHQLLMTLRFYATGTFYCVIGGFGGVHKTTAGKIIKRVSTAICRLRATYIKLPETQLEIETKQIEFYRIARFPKIIGALDCSHVKIQSPGGDQAEIFRNRKGYFSLNVQAVCDANNKFLDIVARWPGSAHDSNIFDNSNIRGRFERGDMGNALLLGDSGYPCRSYLITPLNNPTNAAQNLFNESQIRSRNVIERTFGIWKRRFPVLTMGMRCNIELAQVIITATAVLHNIACEKNDQIPIDAEENNDIIELMQEVNEYGGREDNDGIRLTLIQYFEAML